MEKKPSRKRTPLRRAPEDSGSAAKDSHGPSKVDPIHVEGGPLSKDAGDSDSDVIVEFHENVMSSDFGSHLSVLGTWIYNALYRWDLLLTEGFCCQRYLSITVFHSLQGQQPKDGCRGWTNQRWEWHETFELRDVPHDVIPFDLGGAPHFSVFLPKPTALSHEFGFLFVEFHLDPMFPVTARCKKNQCPP